MTDNTYSPTTITEIVIESVHAEASDSLVTLASRFSDLDIESMTFAEILMDIEDRLGASLGLEEGFVLTNDATVGALVNAVTAQLATS